MRHVFDRTRIGSIPMRNRFIRSGTWEAMASDEGYVTDRLVRVYEALAEGGVGLIITGLAVVTVHGWPRPRMVGIHDDHYVEGLRRLTGAIHRRSGRVLLQIGYGGSQATSPGDTRDVWGPSAVPELSSGVVPRAMVQDDIRRLVYAFGDAAVRAREAGFDGIQIHAAHGFLLSQFLSPYHNRRKDEYGGPIENRARLILEIYREIRNRVGPDFGVWAKVNAEDFVAGGATFEDCRHVCRELARMGTDTIEVSGGVHAAGERTYSRPKIDSTEKEAYLAGHAAAIAEEIETPVALVGGLRTLSLMERLLATTKISYFSMARPLVAEPDLVARWAAGDTARARCISCNRCRSKEGNICIHRRSLDEALGAGA